MNIAVIFAGGTGKRMNTKSKPKQFLEMHGKPVLIYTLENFQNHPLIDHIILVGNMDRLCRRSHEKVRHYKGSKDCSWW